MMTFPKCFACDKPVKKPPCQAITDDGQEVWVGPECWRKIKATKMTGYQPPKGGPKLFI